MCRFLAILLYGIVLALPFYFVWFLIPILNEARERNVSAQDITLYELQQQAKVRFADYSEQIAVENQKGYLIEQFGGETKFGRDVWQALIEWGREILEADGKGDNVSDEEAVRTAMKRILGTDEKVKQADMVFKHFQASFPLPGNKCYSRSLMIVLHLLYPNDDIAYLAVGFQFAWEPRPNKEDLYVFWNIMFWAIALALIIQRGMRLLTIRCLARFLGLHENPLFKEYEQSMFKPKRRLIELALVIPISWWLATMFINPFYVLYCPSKYIIYAGVSWNVLIAGVLAESLENIITLSMIQAGYVPHQIIWDNVLVVAIVIPLLLYTQDSWFTILPGIVVGLVGNVVYKVQRQGKAKADEASAESDG
ncbi:hypothetical protein AYO44_17515 [Planctomycetaceae bacterium SCGC AG-212-F19]|nr:hypothetical protein AYO44_17515 [Planctomycetaceae bacterium SCGC AG-212-F19]